MGLTRQNNAMHTEPPIARFANGERFSGGPVIAVVFRFLSTRIVTRLPLNRLWDDDGDIAAQRERYLSRFSLREMLRQYPVEFYVADIGSPLRRVDVASCYDFWKSEAAESVVNDPEAVFRVEDFAGGFAYVAWEWSGEIETPIVLLEKHH